MASKLCLASICTNEIEKVNQFVKSNFQYEIYVKLLEISVTETNSRLQTANNPIAFGNLLNDLEYTVIILIINLEFVNMIIIRISILFLVYISFCVLLETHS